MKVAIVGAGRVGTALAVLLRRVGHEIVALSGRQATGERAAAWLAGVPVVEPAQAAALGELVVLSVPDDAIGPVAVSLAAEGALVPGAWVAHTAGAVGLDVLAPAAAAGARRLALHPLQTFADVEHAIDTIPGCTVAVTADDEEGFLLGGSLAHDLGASSFRLRDDLRPLYHAAAVFASNYLVATSGVAERLFRASGIPDPVAGMRPLLEATVANVGRLGPADALTGPVVRGDAGTIARNIEALSIHAPDVIPAYLVLCRVALDLAVDRVPPDGRAAIREVLALWS